VPVVARDPPSTTCGECRERSARRAARSAGGVAWPTPDRPLFPFSSRTTRRPACKRLRTGLANLSAENQLGLFGDTLGLASAATAEVVLLELVAALAVGRRTHRVSASCYRPDCTGTALRRRVQYVLSQLVSQGAGPRLFSRAWSGPDTTVDSDNTKQSWASTLLNALGAESRRRP